MLSRGRDVARLLGRRRRRDRAVWDLSLCRLRRSAIAGFSHRAGPSHGGQGLAGVGSTAPVPPRTSRGTRKRARGIPRCQGSLWARARCMDAHGSMLRLVGLSRRDAASALHLLRPVRQLRAPQSSKCRTQGAEGLRMASRRPQCRI